MLFKYSFTYKPGHGCVLQSWDSLKLSVQSDPPFAGAGLSHDRILVLVPVPHSLEHELHLDQSPTPPLTENNKILKFLKYNDK